MYIYIYTYTHKHTHINTYANSTRVLCSAFGNGSTFLSTHAYVYTRIHAKKRTCVAHSQWKNISVHTYKQYIHTCMHTNKHAHTYVSCIYLPRRNAFAQCALD